MPVAAPSPEAADAVQLSVSKSWDSGAGTWQLDLSWSGGTAPYTVSYSTDPSFQRGDRTLAAQTSDSGLTKTANGSAVLECFTVTDAEGVSPSVQGTGSDPYPDIPVPTIQQDGRWWGDDVTLTGNYLDLMAQENFLGLAARAVQATSVTDGGSGYATAASFTIPEDARGSYAFLSTHGVSPDNAPFIHLQPRGLSAYSNIRCVVYAPPTGHVWVAADGKVDEIDLFEHDPSVVRSITAYTKPYLSQCTTGGKILVVDGNSGVSEIDQIDVNSGAVTLYAHTTDTNHTPTFTRTVLPVGLAADPDGSAAYIADATGDMYGSTPVRFPQNNGSAITDNYGNWPYWYFPDPCGIEVGLTHKLYLGSADSWVGYVTAPGGNPGGTQTYFDSDTAVTPQVLIVDRDVSSSSLDLFYYETTPWAMAYNQNSISSLRESTPARNLGADVVGQDSGYLSVEPLWEYNVAGSAPKPVILSNANQAYPYPTTYQVADRVVQLVVRGWQGVMVHLRLIDPPDTAAYAPAGGWAAKGGKTAVPPYEAYDNDVWNDASSQDWGLSATYPGTFASRVLELDVTPDSTNTATFYLKLPPRYAGDNWQIEVTKKTQGGTQVPNKVPTYSAPFTGWKRAFIERDHMFRRGGLLSVDFNKSTCGESCNQVTVYDWANVVKDDVIEVFDEQSPAETAGEIRTVAADPVNNGDGTVTLILDSPLTNDCYYASSSSGSPLQPDFSNGHGGGVGVVHSADGEITDTNSNQINGTGSAFYDADMRNLANTFDDAFVQLIGLRSGMGAVPYLPGTWFSAADPIPLARLSQVWFTNKNPWSPPNQHLNSAHNYFHLLGTSSDPQATGLSSPDSDISFIFVQTIKDNCTNCTALGLQNHVRETTAHEVTHQFRVNCCDTDGHDSNYAWCVNATPPCDNSQHGAEYCLMHVADSNSLDMRTDGIARLDCDDLEAQGPTCGVPACANGISVRTDTDPE